MKRKTHRGAGWDEDIRPLYQIQNQMQADRNLFSPSFPIYEVNILSMHITEKQLIEIGLLQTRSPSIHFYFMVRLEGFFCLFVFGPV